MTWIGTFREINIVYRRKMGFPTPWEYWLSGPQLDDLEHMLLEPRAMERKLFRGDTVKRIFSEHRAKTRDHGNRIWRLLNLEIWHRVFIDGEPMEAISVSGASASAVAVN